MVSQLSEILQSEAFTGKLTMNSFDLGISRQGILAELSADATLLVPTERNSKMRVLRAIDLKRH